MEELLTKLYERYNIEKYYCGWFDYGDLDSRMVYEYHKTEEEYNESCECDIDGYKEAERKYPPLLDEKLVKIQEYLLTQDKFEIGSCIVEDNYRYFISSRRLESSGAGSSFKEAFINLLIDLTENTYDVFPKINKEQRNKIRNLLEI